MYYVNVRLCANDLLLHTDRACTCDNVSSTFFTHICIHTGERRHFDIYLRLCPAIRLSLIILVILVVVDAVIIQRAGEVLVLNITGQHIQLRTIDIPTEISSVHLHS